MSPYFSHTSFPDGLQASRSKTQNVPCVDAGFIKHAPAWMEGFAVTCQLAPGVPHLLSGSCSSPRTFGWGFLQTTPRDDALALLLAFGSAETWHGDFHPISSVPCPAHTPEISGGRKPSAGVICWSIYSFLIDIGRILEGNSWIHFGEKAPANSTGGVLVCYIIRSFSLPFLPSLYQYNLPKGLFRSSIQPFLHHLRFLRVRLKIPNPSG